MPTPQPRNATRLNDYRQAIIAACHQLWDEAQPDLLIAEGHPGVAQNDNIVGFGRGTDDQDDATIGPRRQRESTMSLAVLFSIFRAGGMEAEKVARDYAYDRLRELENYVRATDTELGGVVRYCFITSIQDEGVDPALITNGRLIEVQAIFTAHTRITS